MKIHYFDFVAKGGVHTTFNSAMIEVLRKVFPESAEVVFHSEKEHGRIVREKCASKITFEALNFLFSRAVRFSKVRDLLSINFIVPQLIKSSADDVFFVGLGFPFLIRLVNFFSRIFRKHVFICLHGELQYFLPCDEKYIQLKHRKYFCSVRKCLENENKYVTYVVLGRPVFESVSHIFKGNRNVIVINHPALFCDEGQENHAVSLPLKIGMIGGGLERKGVESIFEIAGFLKDEILQGRLVLKILGFYSGKSKNESKNLVEYFDRILPEDELDCQIKNLDFSLQLTTDKICRAVASGTLIDSLRYGKPVLGLHSSYLDYYAKGRAQDLVCSSAWELSQKIKDILKNFCEESYAEYAAFALEMRRSFSVEFNAEIFKRQMKA